MLDRTGEKYNLRRQLVTSVETTNVKRALKNQKIGHTGEGPIQESEF